MKQRGMFGHPITHDDVREGQVLILFALNGANLSKSFPTCLNRLLCKAINLGMIP
jgi:hypothetical protein